MNKILFTTILLIFTLNTNYAQVFSNIYDVCKTGADPNTLPAFDEINMANECVIVRDTVNNITYEYDASLAVGSRWVVSSASVEVSHSELLNLMFSKKLLVGNHYTITDYQTKYEIDGTGELNTDVHDGSSYGDMSAQENQLPPIEPLTVLATSDSTVSNLAFSAMYPQDIIHYNPFDTTVLSQKRPGYIYYREDRGISVSAHYDWRNVKFRRWYVDLNDPTYRNCPSGIADTSSSYAGYFLWSGSNTNIGKEDQLTPNPAKFKDVYTFAAVGDNSFNLNRVNLGYDDYNVVFYSNAVGVQFNRDEDDYRDAVKNSTIGACYGVSWGWVQNSIIVGGDGFAFYVNDIHFPISNSLIVGMNIFETVGRMGRKSNRYNGNNGWFKVTLDYAIGSGSRRAFIRSGFPQAKNTHFRRVAPSSDVLGTFDIYSSISDSWLNSGFTGHAVYLNTDVSGIGSQSNFVHLNSAPIAHKFLNNNFDVIGRFDNDSTFNLPFYGQGNITGTPSTYPAFDENGKLIEQPIVRKDTITVCNDGSCDVQTLNQAFEMYSEMVKSQDSTSGFFNRNVVCRIKNNSDGSPTTLPSAAASTGDFSKLKIVSDSVVLSSSNGRFLTVSHCLPPMIENAHFKGNGSGTGIYCSSVTNFNVSNVVLDSFDVNFYAWQSDYVRLRNSELKNTHTYNLEARQSLIWVENCQLREPAPLVSLATRNIVTQGPSVLYVSQSVIDSARFADALEMKRGFSYAVFTGSTMPSLTPANYDLTNCRIEIINSPIALSNIGYKLNSLNPDNVYITTPDHPIPLGEYSTADEPAASSGIRFYWNTDCNCLKETKDGVNWTNVVPPAAEFDSLYVQTIAGDSSQVALTSSINYIDYEISTVNDSISSLRNDIDDNFAASIAYADSLQRVFEIPTVADTSTITSPREGDQAITTGQCATRLVYTGIEWNILTGVVNTDLNIISSAYIGTEANIYAEQSFSINATGVDSVVLESFKLNNSELLAERYRYISGGSCSYTALDGLIDATAATTVAFADSSSCVDTNLINMDFTLVGFDSIEYVTNVDGVLDTTKFFTTFFDRDTFEVVLSSASVSQVESIADNNEEITVSRADSVLTYVVPSNAASKSATTTFTFCNNETSTLPANFNTVSNTVTLTVPSLTEQGIAGRVAVYDQPDVLKPSVVEVTDTSITLPGQVRLTPLSDAEEPENAEGLAWYNTVSDEFRVSNGNLSSNLMRYNGVNPEIGGFVYGNLSSLGGSGEFISNNILKVKTTTDPQATQGVLGLAINDVGSGFAHLILGDGLTEPLGEGTVITYAARWPMLKLGGNFEGTNASAFGNVGGAPKLMIGNTYEKPSPYASISMYLYNPPGNQQYSGVGILNTTPPKNGLFPGNIYGQDFGYVSRAHFSQSHITSSKVATAPVSYNGYAYNADWDYSNIDSIGRSTPGGLFTHSTYAYRARLKGANFIGTTASQRLYGYYADVTDATENWAIYVENGDTKLENYILNTDQDLTGRDGQQLTYNSSTGEIELQESYPFKALTTAQQPLAEEGRAYYDTDDAEVKISKDGLTYENLDKNLANQLPEGPVTMNANGNLLRIDTAGMVIIQNLDNAGVDYQFTLSNNTSIPTLISRYEAGDTISIQMQGSEITFKNSTGQITLSELMRKPATGQLAYNSPTTYTEGSPQTLTGASSSNLFNFTATDSSLVYAGPDAKFLITGKTFTFVDATGSDEFIASSEIYINNVEQNISESAGTTTVHGLIGIGYITNPHSFIVELTSGDEITMKINCVESASASFTNLGSSLSITELK